MALSSGGFAMRAAPPRTRRRALGETQVHLDFHTPHQVGAIGTDFDPKEFADTLAAAGIDWVNLFAKCHHGWSYYPTRVGRSHPALSFDLLGEQISAVRAAGLGVGVYYTVGWSAADLEAHPEWAETDSHGNVHGINVDPAAGLDDPRPPNSWVYLCPDGDYLDMMARQTAEIVAFYDPDGLWFDIGATNPCWCARCRHRMAHERVDPGDPQAVESFNLSRWRRAMRALNSAAGAGERGRRVFLNGTTVLHGNAHHVADRVGALSKFNTHQDLEHMPTTWGGYDRLSLRARHYHAESAELVAMSGRFHTDWGEFGGHKSQRGLEYEARSMIANGARCCFGDQLDPRGRLDAQTYSLLRQSYAATSGLREFVEGASPDSRLAVCASSSEDDDQGLARALLEAHREFVVVAPRDLDPARCDAAVVAGPLPGTADAELERFAAGGGRILALGDALNAMSEATLNEVFGIRGVHSSSADGDYTDFSDGRLGTVAATTVYNYEPGLRLELSQRAQVLASIRDALFDRTYRRYFSHQNAPPHPGPATSPAVHRHGRHMVAAHPLGRIYLRHGAEAHRSLLWALLDCVDERPVISVSGLPPGARVTVMHQRRSNRTLIHALYAPVVQRGRAVVIDDVVTVAGASATVRLDREVVDAFDAVGEAPVELERRADGAVAFALPTIDMHAVVVLRHGEGDAQIAHQ
ncbi:MAG: alpha-L-fucosidase [Acidimicrobiaceae bacterium]|nr:alpha-L-fucosidase [Acidimicrobiaceae bacterium]MCY4295336.1 alpha-L-fucosidase [Acidimicrobiaceae bacterium]